ncbi:MAG: hypothetical protein DI596_05255 [Azospira oryzae]|nr:MAG: hypothetical protein DI596_05255 [Azospira oryzae]PZP80958.1 MAG: hypothetical protein DI593_05255 [Azospira oryzae]
MERRLSIPAMRFAIAYLCLSVAAAIPGPTGAEGGGRTPGIALAGIQGSHSMYYGYAGILAPFPGARLGAGQVYRLWVDYLGYEYSAAPGMVRAQGSGFEAMAGYQGHRGGTAWGLFLGALYRNTDLNPDDPGNRVRGSRAGLKVQGELSQALTQAWCWNGSASFETAGDGYWLRTRFLRSLGGSLIVGPEFVLQGGPDYDAQRFGIALAGIPLDRTASLGFSLGVQRTGVGARIGYAGVELAYSF